MVAHPPASPRRPRVYVARRIPEAGLGPIVTATDADVWEGEQAAPRDELLRRVAGIDGLVALLTERIDDELLDAAGPQLRVVSNFAVGVDNVDVAACTRRGIPVGNTPGVLTETSADLAFALLLAVARRLAEGYDIVRSDAWHTWGPMTLLGTDVHGATLGIVGFGRIGQQVARRATGFGMRILYTQRHRAEPGAEAAVGATFTDLPTLLSSSDFVSIHCALTPETHHLVDGAALAQMKPGAVLVNTSRGGVVDQAALYDALRSGHLFGAGLDVTDPEPMRADHPLLTLANCLVVPHIASASLRTRNRMAEKTAANLLAGLRGEPLPDTVNPEVRPAG